MTNPLARIAIPALDDKLGYQWKVLDDGFVRAVDYMGSDAAIVQAARVSYGSGTKTVHEDAGLIRYLMRHAHTTPFEMCEIKLHIRAPMDTWRQWIRHRTASVNEYSTRYSVAIDSAAITHPAEWRRQSAASKQGSVGVLPADIGHRLSEKEAQLQTLSRDIYDERLSLDVAREQARKDLPLSTYTEAYWKIDLHNLLHFLLLRMDAHAQKEIRVYAEVIGHEIVSRWCPIAWQAFLDYRINSLHLTSLEVRLITSLVSGDQESAKGLASQFGWLAQHEDGRLRTNRERAEAEAKLMKIGLTVPWEI